MSASRLNTEQLGRAFASSADAPVSRSAERRRRIVILVWCTTVALAIGAVIGLSVWQGVQEKKKLRNLDIPLQSVPLDGFISNPSGDLQMRKMNNVLMAGAVASAASLGMCADAFAQSSAVQWTTASGGNGHWYKLIVSGPISWNQASLECESLHGHLATINGPQEDNVVANVALQSEGWNFQHGYGPWLGGYQETSANDYTEPTGGWKWVTGEPWQWAAWDQPQYGEPNNCNCNCGDENFLQYKNAVLNTPDRIWNDVNGSGLTNCPQPVSFVIEWETDCNSDGIVDYGQILSGQLTDANSNGIPDSCEVDPCPGDISGNHSVDGVDLAALLGTWGTNGQGEFNCDVDHDGIVGGTDLTIILGGWGPCPPPILPWATVLEQNVNPAVVTDATLRNAITATGLPWRVRDNGTNIEMLLVPGGTFTMGCSPGDAECSGDESPAHQVTLTNAFYMGKTEVTQAQWLAKMGSNPSSFQGQSDSPSRPVEQVSWDTIQNFNSATGLRLPTEAEWEYACRAMTTTARYGVLNDVSWHTSNAGGTTHAVATKLPNALGLYDTLGNVREPCQDWYSSTYYASSPSANPINTTAATWRALRGGDWSTTTGSTYCRSSGRNFISPGYPDYTCGFRVARNP